MLRMLVPPAAMRLKVMTFAVVASLGVMGLSACGDSGATDAEVKGAERKAFSEGRAEGRSEMESANRQRIAQARENGYWEGWDEGWDEGEESLEGIGGEGLEEGPIGGRPLGVDPYPLKQNGEPSYEFEPDDIERAEEASQEVREYCEGAVSEAQEVGCLSHVEPWEVP